MSAPLLLSIVIPTRNRAACLHSLLHTLERYQMDHGHRFQVIVSDNSDDDALRERVDRSPIRIDYRYHPGVLSVVDNFNSTVPLIQGRFACFVGDDDLVTSRLFELVDVMQRDEIDAAVVSDEMTGLYFWPGMTHKRWGDVGAKLYFSSPSGRIKRLDVRRELRRNQLRISDGPLNLPRAYFGVIATDCIRAVLARHGRLFGGCSPDIFSSRLLADVVRKAVAVDLPFIMPGASKTSTSAARAERADVGGLRDNDHTGRFGDLVWSPLVPSFYSPFTVWAQSLIQAEAVAGAAPRALAFAYLYAKCVLFCRGHMSQVRQAVAAQKRPWLTGMLTVAGIAYVATAYLIQKLPLLVRSAPGAAENCVADLPDSDAATRLLDMRCRNIGLRYQDEAA